VDNLLAPTETPLDNSVTPIKLLLDNLVPPFNNSLTSLDDPVTSTKPLNITSEISADALPSYTFGIIRVSTTDQTFGVITPTGRTVEEEDKT
jgi:hypothetical protein